MSDFDSRKKSMGSEEPPASAGEPTQQTPPSELDVQYPGGAPALRRDELLQGRYPEELGDTGDIVQTVAWQSDLFKSLESLKPLKRASEVIVASDDFVIAYRARQASAADYPRLLAQLLDALQETAKTLNVDTRDEIEAMKRNLEISPDALQKAHHDYLVKLFQVL